MVSALGNVVIGLASDWANGNPRKYWHQYGGIPEFDFVFDPVDITSWREKHQS